MIASIYVLCFVAANLLVARFGPWIAPINAFFLIGMGLVARDIQHEKWQDKYLFIKMTALVVASGVISTLINPAATRIATASFCAVIVMGLFDTAVYSMMRKYPFLIRSNTSNVIGALLDSFVFLTIAFGFSLIPTLTMAAAKIVGGLFWSVVAHKTIRRAAIVFFLMFVQCVSAQNIQGHYDIDRKMMTYTYETFTPTEHGTWFGFLDVDSENKNVQQIYTELSYTGPFGLTAEINAGRNEYWNDAVWLLGWQYKFIRLLWRTDGNPQVTVAHQEVWNRLTLCGFADLWIENDKAVFLAEPQAWINLYDQFDVGGEVEVSHNFAGDSGWEVRPTVAMRVRW